MKQYLVFGIFMFVSKRKKTTAKEIAENFEISTRTVYRYIDSLTLAGVPFYCENGKNGGIFLQENFTLEGLVLSQKEKDTLKSALSKNDIGINVKNILDKICV